MAITARTAVVTYATTATANVKLNKPSGVAVNDILIAAFTADGSQQIDTVPSGWTLVGQAVFTNPFVAMYWKRATSSDVTTTSYTWVLNQAMVYGGHMQAFVGVDTTTAMDVTGRTFVDVDTTTTSFGIGLTTVSANTVLVSSLGANTSSAVSATAPSGWTRDPVGASAFTNGKANALAHLTKAAAGAGTYTWTISSGRAGGVVIAALRPGVDPPTVLDPPTMVELDGLSVAAMSPTRLGPVTLAESDGLSVTVLVDAKLSAGMVEVDGMSAQLVSATVLVASITGVDNLAIGLSSWASIGWRTATSNTVDDTGGATSSSVVLTRPSGVAAGDLLVASFSLDANTVSSAPSDWNLAAVGALTQPRVYLYWKLATSADTSTPSYTWQLGAAVAWGGHMQAFINVDQTTPMDVNPTIASDGATPTSLAVSITTATPNAIMVSTLGANTGGTSIAATQPAGWTMDYGFVGGKANALAHVERPTGGASGTHTWTIASGRAMAAVTAALRPRVIMSVTVAGQFVGVDSLTATLRSATALAGALGEADVLSGTLTPSVALSGALVEADSLSATIQVGTPLIAALAEADGLSAALGSPMLLAAALVGSDDLAVQMVSTTALVAAIASVDRVSVRLWMFAPRNLQIVTATAPVRHWSGTEPRSALVGSEPTR